MKNFKLLVVMAAVAFTMAGCSKNALEEDDNNGTAIDGLQAKMNLTITLPGLNTRATPGTPQNGTAAESDIKDISLWIFKADGTTMAQADGGYMYIPFVIGDGPGKFKDNANGTYTYNDLIKTKSDPYAKIYLAANLGNLTYGWAGSENQLLGKFDDTNKTYSYSTTPDGKFYMFSPGTPIALKAYEEGNVNNGNGGALDTETKASFELSRITARVSVTANEGSLFTSGKRDKTINNSMGGITLTYTLKTWRPYNAAKQTFLAPNILPDDATLAITPDYTGIKAGSFPFYNTYSPFKGALNSTEFDQTTLYIDTEIHNMYPGLREASGQHATYQKSAESVWTNDNPTALNELTGYYIGENRDYWTPAANRATTYVMVGTTVSANAAAEWDDDLDDNSSTNGIGQGPGVKYVSGSAYGDGATDIYILRYSKFGEKDQYFITDTEGKRTAIVDGMKAVDTSLTDSNFSEFVYYKGWVHFPVHLDRYNGTHVTNRYGIFRNDFLRVNVTDLLIEDGEFPGYPGNSTYPDEPIDPDGTTPDPNNPDPKDPEEPVDGTVSRLKVTISVAKWNYMTQGTVLQ